MSSSPEEDNLSAAPSSKRRKYPRACDYCRRKKIKCNGPQMPNFRCSKCIYKKIECTYVEPLQKLFYPASHVEALEKRIQHLERLLTRIQPGIDIVKELEQQNEPEGQVGFTVTVTNSLQTHPGGPPANVLPSSSYAWREQSEDGLSEDESELQQVNLIQEFGKASLKPGSYLYHGKSSSMVLLRAAKDLNDQYGEGKVPSASQGPDATTSDPALTLDFRLAGWTCPDIIPPFRDFPPPDLMHTLIGLFFTHVNAYAPLLHEPTFRQNIAQELHRRPGGFGATLLLVCAVGSRFLRGPHTRLEGTDQSNSPAWKWYQQVESVYRSVMAPPDLHDLQIRALMAMYLQGTMVTHACWPHIGAGIRTGIEMGAHRKKRYGEEPTVEAESLKRAFWVLVTIDWGMSYTMGRPSCIHDEDMDLPLPIECDDEYWTDASGEPVFTQPPGKPSKISFFVSYLGLMQVLAFAMRTVYATNKSRVQLRHGDQQWEKRTVAELDSALNKWVDAVPDHLKWDPHREDELFYKQSATLFSHYYLFQIAVHRPFIEKRKWQSPLSFTSIIICINAAKSSIRIVEQVYRRTGTPIHRNVPTLFTAAIVMILHILCEKGSGRPDALDQDIQDVRNCIEMLQVVEHEVPTARHLRNILSLFVIASPSNRGDATVHREPDLRSSGYEPSSSSQGSSSAGSSWAYPEYQSEYPGSTNLVNETTTTAVSSNSQASGHHQQASHTESLDATCMMTNDAAAGPGSFALPLHTEDLSKMYPPMFDTFAIASDSLQGPASQYPSLEPSYGPDNQLFSHPAVHNLSNPNQLAHHADTGVQFVETYGLEPLRYGHAPSLPSDPAYSAMMETSTYEAQYATQAGAIPQPKFGLDCPTMDDAFNTWSNAPSFCGWDDWGPFLSNIGHHGRPTS